MKGSRHRCLDYRAYQNNYPVPQVRPLDRVVTEDGRTGTALKKNYHTSEWEVMFPAGAEIVAESQLTKTKP